MRLAESSATGEETLAANEASVRGEPKIDSEPAITLEASRRRYRLFAPIYDAVFGAGLQHGRRIAVDALACRPGDRVLEVCVGTGLSLPLYPPDVDVTGIDASLEMLRRASLRADRKAALSQILLQMDAERLAFADATFDKAAVVFAIAGLPDPVHAIREIRRVCRPGATIVIATHFQSRGALLRACDSLLRPILGFLHYRTHLDLPRFIAASGLEVVKVLPANFCGHSTVLVLRKR